MSMEYDGVFVGETMLSAERLRASWCESFALDVDEYLTVTPRTLRSYGLPGVLLGNLVVLDSGVALSADTRVALERVINVGRRGVQALKVWALR